MYKSNKTAAELRQQICKLKAKRDNLEEKLINTRVVMKRGALVEIYTKCSTANCKCQKGEKHGPSYYVNLNVKGKIIHRYIGKKKDEKVLRSLKKYKEFKSSLVALNKVNKEIQSNWQQYRDLLTQEII